MHKASENVKIKFVETDIEDSGKKSMDKFVYSETVIKLNIFFLLNLMNLSFNKRKLTKNK